MTPPVKPETKVTWASAAAGVLTVLLFVANHTSAIPGYDTWPAWAKALVSVVVIAGGALGAGYTAPHTPRPDLALYQNSAGLPTPTPVLIQATSDEVVTQPTTYTTGTYSSGTTGPITWTVNQADSQAEPPHDTTRGDVGPDDPPPPAS